MTCQIVENDILQCFSLLTSFSIPTITAFSVCSTLTIPVVSLLVFPFYSPCSYLSNLPDYITLLIKILMASIIYGTKLKILSRAFKECWYSIPGNFFCLLLTTSSPPCPCILSHHHSHDPTPHTWCPPCAEQLNPFRGLDVVSSLLAFVHSVLFFWKALLST